MKGIKYIASIMIVAALGFSSCEDILDVSPTVELADAVALSSTIGLDAAVAGAYDKLQNGYLYGGRYWVSGDMLTGSVKISGLQNTVFEELQMLNKTMSAQSNQIVHATWQTSYEAIGIVNRILNVLPDINDADMTDDVRKRIEGECKFIRGVVFFELSRYYGFNVSGQDLTVPVFTEPLGPFDKPERATIDDAYTQIAQDLEDAALLLDGTSLSGRATAIGAKGYLSRVYFYQENWDKVIEAADYVINLNAAKPNGGLADDVLDCFVVGSLPNEVLFAVQASGTDDASGTLRGYYRLLSNAKFSLDGPYLGKIGANVLAGDDDARARVDHAFINLEGKVYSTKFDLEYFSVPVMRLAEVYLNRAEARVHGGNVSGARDDLNVVRARSGVSDITGSPSLADCESERTIELYLEGDYFHNMKRLKKTNFAKDLSGNKYSWDDVELAFPIPKTQTDLNENLVQNI